MISLDPAAGSDATNMLGVLLFVVHTACIVTHVNAQDFSNAIDVQTLSELPIDRLLSVKNQFELPITEITNHSNETESLEEPLESRESPDGAIAMALRRSKPKQHLKRGGWEESEKSEKKGVQSIFQMSITTLAFLAFGGYLLCLIVQSLKKKGGKKVHVLITSSTAAPVTVMTLRRRRRRRRPTRNNQVRRPIRLKRDVFDEDETHDEGDESAPSVDMTPHIDTEKMFDALVSLSEAYTRYHTVDYKRFNQTIIHF